MWEPARQLILEWARDPRRHLRWSRKARQDLLHLRITREFVEEALARHIEVLEAQPGNRFRVWLGWHDSPHLRRPLHAIVAIELDIEYITVVTVYAARRNEWGESGRERRR